MIVFDTETTGLPLPETAPLESQPRIIEFAAIKLDHDMNEMERLEFLVNPEIPIPKEASAVNNITDDDVKDKPPFVGYYNELCNFFNGNSDIYAHNLAFDMKMLVFELKRLGYEHKFPYPHNHFCTVELSRPLLQNPDDAPRSLRQVDLYWHAFEKKYEAHRAVTDVEALVEYIKWMRKNYLL
jgi:DNA polymerase-3 subunit epsilon